ncbi:MAG TPA: peptidoglycan-binding protein LysM [Flavobacteriaceae bacterium]|nr:peptidoglycan-binding protein LysM [Flavobacteriaceae bacterium]
MGLFSFGKNVGAKIFGKKEDEVPVEEKKQLQATALLGYVKALGLKYNRLRVTVKDDDVLLEGEVAQQSDAEKIVLAIGNVEGVDAVDNQMTVVEPQPEAQFHTVVKGEWLSKISQKYYGDPNKYNIIFEANQPMLDHPDKIYPGQVLRIPRLD